MKPFPTLLAVALFALPLVAWADRNPDFEDDAKPILGHQPGLIQYIHTHFEVKDTGIAKFPGHDDRPPGPPYIFNARPRGASGPFYLRLLIQPGPAGHILKVADIRKLPGAVPPPQGPSGQSGEISQQPSSAPAQPEPAPAPSQEPTSSPISSVGADSSATSSPTPTADTPSGPIPDSGSPSNLAPPADPAPANP